MLLVASCLLMAICALEVNAGVPPDNFGMELYFHTIEFLMVFAFFSEILKQQTPFFTNFVIASLIFTHVNQN